MKKYNQEKGILIDLDDKFKKILNEINIYHYNIETHLDKIAYRNNFILIKIKFNHEKYQQLIKNLNHQTLKFKNEKGELVSTIRKMKLIGNKLDPECFILEKKSQ